MKSGYYFYTMIAMKLSKKLLQMTNLNFEIGQRVEKLGSASDYATGRKGTVVELPNSINVIEPDRVRVKWDTLPSGNPMSKPIKTKVNKAFLRIL